MLFSITALLAVRGVYLVLAVRWCKVVTDLVVSSFSVDLEVSLHGHQRAVVGSLLQRNQINLF